MDKRHSYVSTILLTEFLSNQSNNFRTIFWFHGRRSIRLTVFFCHISCVLMFVRLNTNFQSNVVWPNVRSILCLTTNCLSNNCISAICLFDIMAFGHISIRSNLFRLRVRLDISYSAICPTTFKTCGAELSYGSARTACNR